MSMVFDAEHIMPGKFGVVPEIPCMTNDNKKNNIMANDFWAGSSR